MKFFDKIRYYAFCIRWLYRNRDWSDTRQKYKAMNIAWAWKEAQPK